MYATVALEQHRLPHHRSADAYALTPAQMHEQAKRLLREYPVSGPGRFAAYRVRASSSYSNIARSIECEVFRRFFGDTPEKMRASYGPYEQHSHFLLAIDRESQQPAGTLRVIEDSLMGLKSLNDIRHAPLHLSPEHVMAYHNIDSLANVWDVGTLAVRKAFRGGDKEHFVGTMLYGLFHAAARAADIDHAVAILDGHAYHQLTEKLAVPFETIAGTEPFEYLGAKGSRAAYLKIRKVRPAVQSFMDSMDPITRTTIRPVLARVIYAEGLPELIEVR
jgi:hypothetical protein